MQEVERLPAGFVHIDVRMGLVPDDDVGKLGDLRVDIGVQIEAHGQGLFAEHAAHRQDELQIRAQRERADERAVQ